MGYLLVNIQLPDSASLERTQAVIRQDQRDRRRAPRASPPRWAIAGQSLLLNAFGSNFGSMFVILDELRANATAPRDSATVEAIMNKLRGAARRGDPRGQRSRSSARRRCAAWAAPAA